jgi:hypothetical protein
MTLRNAFEGMSTEASIKALIDELRTFHAQSILARDANDRMRTTLDGTTSVVAAHLNIGAVNDGYPPWYARGSPNSVDAREQLESLSHMAFYETRKRWSFT